MPDRAVGLGQRNAIKGHPLPSESELVRSEEPLATARARLWEVREDNERNDCCNNSACSLKDEQPLPAVQAGDV